MAHAEFDARAAELRDEPLGDRGEIVAEHLPGVGLLGLARVAVAARVEADHAVAAPQFVRDAAPHAGAEAARMVQQRDRPFPAEVVDLELELSVEPHARAPRLERCFGIERLVRCQPRRPSTFG